MSADRRPVTRGSSRRPFARFRAELLERRELLTVQIAQPRYLLANTAQVATVTLIRSSNPTVNPEIVQVATSGGTARADVDYTPVAQSVTFGTGEYSKQITIPLLNAGHEDDRSIGLAVQTLDARGTPAVSTATIELIGQSDIAPPSVQKAVQLRDRGRLTGFQITYSEDMAARPAANYRNYAVTGLVRNSGGFSLKSRETTFNVPIKAASYDPATRTVTLTTAKAFRPATSYAITNPGFGGKDGVTSPICDEAGNLLDSQGDGTADGQLVTQANTHVKDTRGLSLPRPASESPRKQATPARAGRATHAIQTAVVRHKPSGPRFLLTG